MVMFGVLWAWYLTSALCSAQTEAPTSNFSTACYGTPGNGCTDHTLICAPSLVISITNIRFGYRRGCAGNGISNCGDITCCSDRRGDCFTPVNQTLLSELQDICDGEALCILDSDSGLNETSAYCGIGNIRHSYQRIDYLCVPGNSSYTIDSTVETTPSSTVITDSSSRATSTNTQGSSSLSQPTDGARSPSSVSVITVTPDQASPTNTTPSTTTASTNTSSQAPRTNTTSPSTISTDTSSQNTSPSTISTDTSSQAPRTNTHASPPSSQPTAETTWTSTGFTNELPPNQASRTNTQGKDVGAIAGGIVGVILVIAIVAAVIFFIKRRQSDREPSKDIQVNKNGSNQHQNTSPVTNPTPSGKDNLAQQTTGEDNYINIAMSGVTSDDEYHHLKGPNSNKPSVPDSNYNQVGSFNPGEHNYQHIGEYKPQSVTEDTYSHISEQNNTGVISSDNNNIEGHNTDDPNHIGGDNNTGHDNDDDQLIVIKM
ncbi:uncharacterized protein LOC130010829 [Patella vulgata]|uniref:uncharacterized protein LOC130010829 n=1 Tax=Patella vulgata TaxID=6465 RepID=UPI0024A98D1A|nr:uncharacterized protein LOC130010829 [Patella vulgata]XP_055954887.1 uncharacterized protein LOC130010829 [Patella vulgata]XP_055954888.1 uncharacterized protein LOC130010829 [Patella vulgata]XP_055954889.1 uncharacterized protein LOC130010829 [Patella vulgata]